MAININCQYCNKSYICMHPTRTKFLRIFKRQCIYVTGQLTAWQICLIQKAIPRPRKKLKLAYPQKTCEKCQFYNKNWQKEWSHLTHLVGHIWCEKKNYDMLDDKKSEELGHCRYFTKKKNKRMKAKKIYYCAIILSLVFTAVCSIFAFWPFMTGKFL